MAHSLQARYSPLVLAKLRDTLVTRDNFIFSNTHEGDPKAGVVKIPVRDTEVALRSYDKATGIPPQAGTTTYVDLLVNNDVAVNEVIDGYDAQAVPDGIVAERLDSAGEALAGALDSVSLALLESEGTAVDDVAPTAETVYADIVKARTALSKAKVPGQGRWLLVSPDTFGLMLQSDSFIRQSDLSQEMKATGAIGQIAGFAVYEANTLAESTAFIAGHPNWAHRVSEFKVDPYLQDLNGDANFVGASAVKGRMVFGVKISKPATIYVRTITAG